MEVKVKKMEMDVGLRIDIRSLGRYFTGEIAGHRRLDCVNDFYLLYMTHENFVPYVFFFLKKN